MTQPPIDERQARPLIRSFAPRRGRITTAQQRALEELLPRYLRRVEDGPLDPEVTFGRRAPLVLEIGSGMGDATALIAAEHPELDFLACEVFPAGVGSLCRLLDRAGLSNVRVCQADAMIAVPALITEGSLAGVHIFFPDPWPKARHHKRRLLRPEFVAQLAVRLRPGGYLHCATDWEEYAEEMLVTLTAEPLLRNASPDGFAPDRANPLCVRPLTKFERRGLALGHRVRDLVFQRLQD